MKIAFLTTDNREQRGQYHLERPYFGTAPQALLDGFAALGDEIEVHVISCAKKRMASPEKLADNIWFHQPIVPHIGWGRTAFLGCVWAVRKLIKDLEPDLVHGQGTERDCAMAAVHSRYPNVLTIHGNMERIYQMGLLGANSYYWLAAKLETHALRRTGGVFCNSRHTESLVRGRTRRTWQVANPVRKVFLQEPMGRGAVGARPVFLVVGVVSRLKRPLEILQTMKTLHQAGHKFLVRFVGSHSTDHPYGAEFEELLRQAETSGYAEYVGLLGEEDLVMAMDEADALIHFPEEEAFGLVVAESLARGLKVFASRIGGIPDILANTSGSEMYDDLEGLGSGVKSWLENGCPRPRGNEALMCERYSPESIGRRHIEIYNKLIPNL